MKTQIKGFGLKGVIYNTSLAGWILLARPIINIIFSRRRDLNDYAAVDFSAMVFILYAVVALFIGCRAIFNSQSWLGKTVLLRSPLVIFLIYCIWGLVSMFWSVGPQLTGYRAFECIAMTVLIVAVMQELFEKGSLKFIILWSVLYCTWNILWAIIRTMQWTMELSTILESSQMMATIFFFMALYFVPRRWYNYLILIMSVFSMSTVSYIGMAIGSISSFWNRGKGRFITIAGAFVLLLVVIAVGPYKLLKDTIFFDKKEISIENTSGRDQLYEVTMETIDEYPWGLGFFSAEPYIFYSRDLHAIGAHNSFLSAGLGIGIPGMIIIGIFFSAIGIVTFSRYIPRKYQSIMIGCFCVAFLQCMGNPSVGTRVYGAWIPCMYIFALICGMYIYGKYLGPVVSDENEIDK